MIVWGIFISAILFALALDLGVFNRKAHVISTKEASIWTMIWVSLAFAFSGVIYWLYGTDLIDNPSNMPPLDAMIKYITGYLIELSLSIDNIFVIAVIFSSFNVPQKFQHRVLFWGILGAIVFRAIMIFFGVALINRFSWMIYLFGAFLLYTAYKMLVSKDQDFDPHNSFVFKQIRKVIPITKKIDGEHFFIRKKHIYAATPLFVVLLVIEGTDILFALDSIPAILAITSDPFLVFSSNIMAILGLRSMYFFLSNMLEKFHYLKYSLVAILSFVGIKMLLAEYVHLPEWVSLAFIAFSLGVGIVVSLNSSTYQKNS
ncbi:MAG: membrane protein [Saprospiraceae bacterium]|nr:MAG: membrane protein [Saprospiraceae bacterium]